MYIFHLFLFPGEHASGGLCDNFADVVVEVRKLFLSHVLAELIGTVIINVTMKMFCAVFHRFAGILA